MTKQIFTRPVQNVINFIGTNKLFAQNTIQLHELCTAAETTWRFAQ
jgi:hypothetical protein